MRREVERGEMCIYNASDDDIEQSAVNKCLSKSDFNFIIFEESPKPLGSVIFIFCWYKLKAFLQCTVY